MHRQQDNNILNVLQIMHRFLEEKRETAELLKLLNIVGNKTHFDKILQLLVHV